LYYNTTSGAYQVKIKLKKSDKDLLYQIKNRFPYFCDVSFERHPKGFDSVFIYTYNKDFYQDLIKLGVFPNKSHNNSHKCFYPDSIIPNDFFGDYIRGLWDGDGTIHQDKKGRIRTDLCGKNQNLFKQVSGIFNKRYNISSSVYYRKDRDYYLIRISEKSNIKSFINLVKTDSGLVLNRKLKPYFNIPWDRIPGYDNMHTDYKVYYI